MTYAAMNASFKRTFDCALLLATSPLWLPLMGLVAVWLLVHGQGSVIHRQARVGQGGRAFRMHKFRTLLPDADELPTVAPDGDPRITRPGAFLRRWRLDELPQIFDVLRGKMSLVGPRPEIPGHLREIPASVKEKVYAVRPGITGPAAVAFLAEDDYLATVNDPVEVYCRVILPEKLRLELKYVERRSFATDLKLIVQTFLRVVSTEAHRESRDMIEQIAAARRQLDSET